VFISKLFKIQGKTGLLTGVVAEYQGDNSDVMVNKKPRQSNSDAAFSIFRLEREA